MNVQLFTYFAKARVLFEVFSQWLLNHFTMKFTNPDYGCVLWLYKAQSSVKSYLEFDLKWSLKSLYTDVLRWVAMLLLLYGYHFSHGLVVPFVKIKRQIPKSIKW